MTDPNLAGVADIKAAGLRPRRFRVPATLIRRLIWPALRAWFYGTVRQVTLLQGELDRVRQDAQADRAAMAGMRHQIENLQATLAAFTIERAFFENTVRTELMAIGNVVDCYRESVEQVLEARPEPLHAVAKLPPVRA